MAGNETNETREAAPDPKELARNIQKDFDKGDEGLAQYRLWSNVEKFNKNPELRAQTAEELKALGFDLKQEKHRYTGYERARSSTDVIETVISRNRLDSTSIQSVTFKDSTSQYGHSRETTARISSEKSYDSEIYGTNARDQIKRAFELYVKDQQPKVSDSVYSNAMQILELGGNFKNAFEQKNFADSVKLVNGFYGQEVITLTGEGSSQKVTLQQDKDNFVSYDAKGNVTGKYQGQEFSVGLWNGMFFAETRNITSAVLTKAIVTMAQDTNSTAVRLEQRMDQLKEHYGRSMISTLGYPDGYNEKVRTDRSAEEIAKLAKQISIDVCRSEDPMAKIRLNQADEQISGSFNDRLQLLPQLADLGVIVHRGSGAYMATKQCDDGSIAKVQLRKSGYRQDDSGRSEDFRLSETAQSKSLDAISGDLKTNSNLSDSSQKIAASLVKGILGNARADDYYRQRLDMTEPVKTLLSLPRDEAEKIVSQLNKAIQTDALSIGVDGKGQNQLVLKSSENSNIVYRNDGKVESASDRSRSTKDTRYVFESSRERENAQIASSVLSQLNQAIEKNLTYSDSSVVRRLDQRREELAAKLTPELEKIIPSAEVIQATFALANPELSSMTIEQAEKLRKSMINNEIYSVAAGVKSEDELTKPSLLSMYSSMLSGEKLSALRADRQADDQVKESLQQYFDRDWTNSRNLEAFARLHRRLFTEPNPPVRELFAPDKVNFLNAESAQNKFAEAITVDMKKTDMSKELQSLTLQFTDLLLAANKGESWADVRREGTFGDVVRHILTPPLTAAAEVVDYLNKVSQKDIFSVEKDSSGNGRLVMKDGNMKMVWNQDGRVDSATIDVTKKKGWLDFSSEPTLDTAEKVRQGIAQTILALQKSSDSSVSRIFEKRREDIAAKMLPQLESKIPSIETIQREFELANNNDKISREDAEFLRKSIMMYAVQLAAVGMKSETLEERPLSTYSLSSMLTADQLRSWQPYASYYVVNARDLAKKFSLSAEQAERADKLERLHKRLFPNSR